ncbi:MAG: MFS transporter, partial [Rhodospirillales bacterium]|nr:MFS transporter [Rhodospirillales bacterium]
STVWGVATLIGPGFGGIFAELGYWPGAFWALCALSLIVTVAAWKIIVPTIGHGDLKTIPYRRLALLAASVLTLSLTSNVDTNWARALLILFSAVLAIVAFRLDSRAEITMVPRRATSLAGQMGIAYWTLFLTTVVIVFLNVYATLFLQKLHGSTPLAAAYLSAIMSFAWTGGAFIVATWRGVLELVAIGLGLVILLIGAIGVALFVTSGPVLYLSIAFFLMGLGTGFFNNPLIQRAIAGAEEHERHIAGASVQTVRTLAIAFGASMAGIIAAIAGLGTTPEPSILAHAMNWVFGINVIFAVLAILVCLPLLLSRRHRPTPKTEAAE